MRRIGINQRLVQLKASAKARNIAVDLNVDYYRQLLELGCMYCGESLVDKSGYGLDRLDNTRGYVFDNVTPCCGLCNRAKGTMSSSDFVSWVNKTHTFMQNKIKELEENPITSKFIKKMENIAKNRSSYKNSAVIKLIGERK